MKKNKINESTSLANLLELTQYYYIEHSYLYEIIKKLTDEKIIFEENNLYKNKYFLEILKKLIIFVEREFPIAKDKKLLLNLVIENNKEMFSLINEDIYNSLYFEFKIKKYLVRNMYSNIQIFYDEYKTIFKKVHINKKMNLSNEVDVNILFLFMKDLVWCNSNNENLKYIFINLLYKLNYYTKKGIEKDEKEYINSFFKVWNIIIENYLMKIDHLRIFLKK